jgi:hypothetical protein
MLVMPVMLPPGLPEAFDESFRDRVASHRKHDRNGRRGRGCSRLGHVDRGGSERRQEVDAQPHQLGRQSR